MRILPCDFFHFAGTSSNLPPKNKKNTLNNKQTVVGGVTLAGTLAVGLGYYLISRGKKAPKINSEEIVARKLAQLQELANQMEKFPMDIEYRKALMSGVDGSITNPAFLRTIVGPEEIKSIVRNFSDNPECYTPGKQLITTIQGGYDLSGVTNSTFRANLHMHTVHSDGALTIQELLDKSAAYADQVAEEMPFSAPANHAPFTIAITDHDTVEGCKEAVKIISQNPIKYKNLRVILGCELTVESQMVPQKLKSPVPIHMLLHGINPFDTSLNAFLEKTKAGRVEVINSVISKAVEKLKTEFPKSAAKLSYKDAEELYPTFKHRILHVDYCTKDYLQFRTIFSECIEENPEMQKLFAGKGLTPNYVEPKEMFFDNIKGNFGNKYWRKYLSALQSYAAKVLDIPQSEAMQKIRVSRKLENKLEELAGLANDSGPKLKLSKAYNDMAESIEFMKKQDYGFVSIAHPALTGMGDCLVNPNESFQAMKDLLKIFKEKAGERALEAEVYYPYFGELGNSKDWLKAINYYVKEAGLFNGGGIDTHGTNIFYTHSNFD